MIDFDERERSETGGLSTADLATAGKRPKEEIQNVPVVAANAGSEDRDENEPLLSLDEAASLRRKWDEVQGGFVDEPRRSVQQADALVAAEMKRLAEMFADERAKLEAQWDRGDSVSTEDLRVALRRYRTFFNRLLSI
ncbi:hypothetical protein GMLC_16020 [Geomonas limicola]|uniref:Uncharacterized protein n=1 Tax=Geomonas limicola TaxID=2740186 RepID=A0A6V8N934_9BACT|nr:hypothetical protein GMLC_16020 [Geomonas limicola]